MPSIYNDIEDYAVKLLKLRIDDGWLPAGEVTNKDIRILCEEDLSVYDQVHLFAGIGGFPLACRIAGLPDDFPIFTAGFPCQPFSAAGKRAGTEDNRYLWPETLTALKRHKPAFAILENVAGLASMGFPGTPTVMDSKKFAEGVHNYEYRKRELAVANKICEDLEQEGYSVTPIIVPACGVNAKHERKRIWFIAISNSYANWNRSAEQKRQYEWAENRRRSSADRLEAWGDLANSSSGRCSQSGEGQGKQPRGTETIGASEAMANANRTRKPQSEGIIETQRGRSINSGEEKGILANSESQKSAGLSNGADAEHTRLGKPSEDGSGKTYVSNTGRAGLEGEKRSRNNSKENSGRTAGADGTASKLCSDERGSNRPTKPRMGREINGLSDELDAPRAFGDDWEDGIARVITGLKGRVNRVKGLGNAIVPQVAAEIIKIFIEAYGVNEDV